jgi:hypothetical protein
MYDDKQALIELNMKICDAENNGDRVAFLQKVKPGGTRVFNHRL